MEQIKLVIWDLDDTFWNGTLSEGDIVPIKSNIDLVKSLVDRGIMNSISSKNELENAKLKLQELGVWEYFIFPLINWQPKGENVKYIINQAQLRPNNVLFIDDNHLNIKEVKFYNDEISVEYPDFISQILAHSSFVGKPDLLNSRLDQYRVLEAKQLERKEYSDNTDFLNSSGIKLAILDDVESNFDRILELINRTNQINYTKKRIAAGELRSLLVDTDYKCQIIKVKDRFGEYGIVGFYALHVSENRLEHFLFSCRSMNIGVEQYVYAMLNFPELKLVGSVTTQLNNEGKSDWIEQIDDWSVETNKADSTNSIKILLKGACDLSQMMQYVTYDNIVMDTEFNHVNDNNHPVSHASSMILMQSMSLPKKIQDDICESLPFLDKGIFETKLFKEDYDVLIYSMLTDYTLDLYKSNKTGAVIPYEAYSRLEREGKEGFLKRCMNNDFKKMDADFYDEFTSEYEPIGQITPEVLLENLNKLRNEISKPIILINGAEKMPNNKNEANFILSTKRHSKMNKLIDDFCSKHDDVYLLDVRKFIGGNDINQDLRYYKRHIYEKMANELVSILEGLSVVKLSKNVFTYNLNKVGRMMYVFMRRFYRKGKELVYVRVRS